VKLLFIKEDLNYRIDLAEDEVVELIGDPMKPYNLATLMEYDEVCSLAF
jgi:hypothetical protein